MLDLIKRYWRTINRPERVLQPRLPDARRVYRGRGVLGRVQYGTGSDQHRSVLHGLPRDARQHLRRTEDHDSLFRTAAACALNARIATCRTTGPTRWRERCRRRRKCGRRCSARSTPARNSWIAGSNSPSTNGSASRPTTRWSAAIATRSNRWISRAKARAPRMRIRRFLATGEKTCIDCHKGIAHQLPNMTQAALDEQARTARARAMGEHEHVYACGDPDSESGQ